MRVVGPEALDHLAVDDPAAVRSRSDLQRVHQAMGTRAILLRALQGHFGVRDRTWPMRILELGAGDGTLMLQVAQTLSAQWPPVELTLVDRQPLVRSATLASYARLGWQAHARVDDALKWAGTPTDELMPSGGAGRWDLIVANLFLHHFEAEPLASLLRAIAARGDRFIACEPRRGWPALAGSYLIGALGVNAVTRSDAVLSVRAGFRDLELTARWPPGRCHWFLQESSAGLFSHCFRAMRIRAA